MSQLFTLSHPRKIHFFVLLSTITFTFFLLYAIEPFSPLVFAGCYLVAIAAIFLFFRVLDHDEKQSHYEEMGYQYLTKTENGETVLHLVVKPSKMLPDGAIVLAIFDKEGFLKRQTRVLKEDAHLAQLVLNQEEKEENLNQ